MKLSPGYIQSLSIAFNILPLFRNSNVFKSFEEKVGGAYTNVKVSGLNSSSEYPYN